MAEFQEWRNKNSYRSYPIADDATWVTAQGTRIPSDIFIDALITPIDPDGTVFLSSINFNDSTVAVSDDSGVIATAAISSGDLTLVDSYGRNIGVIVPSPTFYELSGNLTFQAHALPFASASVMPQSQSSVRGFRLPDGTLITGDVEFIGIDGVLVSADPDNNAIVFSAVGKPDPPDCVDLCGPVKCVTVLQVGSGGVWAVNFTEEGVLSLDAAYDLEDVCEDRRQRVLPTDGDLPNVTDDQCDDPDPEEPIDPPEPVDPVTACVNRISILPVSTLVGIEALEEPGIPAYPASAGVAALPERPQQGVKLYMRGL